MSWPVRRAFEGSVPVASESAGDRARRAPRFIDGLQERTFTLRPRLSQPRPLRGERGTQAPQGCRLRLSGPRGPHQGEGGTGPRLRRGERLSASRSAGA